MLDKEAIKALQHSGGIEEASVATAAALAGDRNVVALPDDFLLHDLEAYMPVRRRARGTMRSSVIADFAQYTDQHAQAGVTVFVNQDDMSATAVLNLGSPEIPGHADDRAILGLKSTAAFTALKSIANGAGKGQKEVAEFLEDWTPNIQCFDGNETIALPQAIAAVRNVTIEAMRKIESQEQSLSASRSSFENITASSKLPLPTLIYFECEPYQGLPSRMFVLRLGVLTGGDKPQIVLRIIKAEEHQEQMAGELGGLIVDAFNGKEIPVLIGSYSAGK